MKLTNAIRDAFIRAVMADVPSVDYDEQAANLAQADYRAQMPLKVRAVFDDKALRGFLLCEWEGMPGTLDSCYLFKGELKLSADGLQKLDAINDLKAAQDTARHDLRQKLKGTAYSVTTRKALADMLPEFEKYLPVDDAAALRTLPVVQNVVADFVKAGWPKGKKAAA